jgi:hypothetical protein
MLTFIDMHASNKPHIYMFGNAICYFNMDFVPIKGNLIINISTVNQRVPFKTFFLSIRSISNITATMALVTIVIVVVVFLVGKYFNIMAGIL